MGKRVLVVGSSHSAFNVLLDLVDLAAQEPGMAELMKGLPSPKILTIIYMFNYHYPMTTLVPLIQPDGCISNPVDPPPMSEDERATILATFKALSDATRFEVFRFVAAQEAPICACDIGERFTVSQPTIAHHLKVLRQAGLITSTRNGVWVYYAVDPRGMEVLTSTTREFAMTVS